MLCLNAGKCSWESMCYQCTSSSVNALPCPVELLMLLKKHHCRNRLRTQSNEARHPASKHPKQSFLFVGLRQCFQDANLPTSRHDACLYHINRGTDGRSHEPSCQRRGKM